MNKFKIVESKEESISSVFSGGETEFTNDYLTKPENFAKILKAIGRSDAIETPIESQVLTTDGKQLDNLVTLAGGERIALEALCGTTDMLHAQKLTWYMEDLIEENETMIGILIAEDITDQAIKWYTRMNQIKDYDLYIVKSVWTSLGESAMFNPILIYPTPTTNNFRAKKAQQTPRNVVVHQENVDKVTDHLYGLQAAGILNFRVNNPDNHGLVRFICNYNGHKIHIEVKATGTLGLAMEGSHTNEVIFRNNKNYYRLASATSTNDFEKLKIMFQEVLDNVNE